MSNSYKKHPVYKWHGKGAKRQSSKRFRRYKGDIPIHSRRFDRRIFNSWDVIDNWYWEFEYEQRAKEYRLIVEEIYNAFDNNMTEEELAEKIDRLNDLQHVFFYKRK